MVDSAPDRAALSRAAQEPIVAALRERGLDIDSLSDLVNGPNTYDAVLEVLIDWVPRCQFMPTRQLLVRALTVPAARRTRAPDVLLDEFVDAPGGSGYRWAVGNALALVARPEHASRILELFSDRRYGIGRQELARAIARLKPTGSVDVLLAALDDPDVRPHAIEALGSIKHPQALATLTPLQHHEDELTARTARAAVARIQRARH